MKGIDRFQGIAFEFDPVESPLCMVRSQPNGCAAKIRFPPFVPIDTIGPKRPVGKSKF
jgi:hypothetical protein